MTLPKGNTRARSVEGASFVTGQRSINPMISVFLTLDPRKSPPSAAPTPVIRFEMARAHRELARDEARKDERRSAAG